MPLTLLCKEDLSNAPHSFKAFELSGDSDWLEQAAEEYARLRTETRHPLRPVSVDGIGVLDVTNIQERMTRHLIPERRRGPFCPVRSDFGEVLGIMLLREKHGAHLAYIAVRDRERFDLPGRSIDFIGIEQESNQLTLVLGEVKVSEESGRTPQVVDDARDSLSKQLVMHMQEHTLTCSKIFDAARRASDPDLQNLFLAAALYWEEKKWDSIAIICCAVLIRPTDMYHSRDFGNLKDSPEQVTPATVRFAVLCVPEEINAVVDKFHHLANGGTER